MSKAPSHNPVTKQRDFWNATTDGECLFSVRGGVPLRDAFDQLTVLLAAGHSALDDVRTTAAAGDVPQSLWAATHTLEFAYSLVQSMHQGLIEHEKAVTRTLQPR